MAFCMKCGATVEGAFCIQCGTPVGVSGGAGPEVPPQPPAARPMPPQPPAGPAPKKHKALLWVLCGCLGLIVIGIITVILGGSLLLRRIGFDSGLLKSKPEVAMAKMMISANPDLELVSMDEDKGIVKVRDKKTGKTLTMNFENIKQGKFVLQDDQGQTVEFNSQGEGKEGSIEVRSSEGTMRMGTTEAAQLPAWLPAYPGAESAGAISFSKDAGNSGSCSFKSGDSPDAIASFYEDALTKAGFNVKKNATQIPGQGAIIVLEGTDSAQKRTVQVTAASGTEEGTTLSLIFKTGD